MLGGSTRLPHGLCGLLLDLLSIVLKLCWLSSFKHTMQYRR